MKELSIEQKAQRYDEAIERARYWEKNPTVWSSDDICQKLFPELKESEESKDERIRKLLLESFKSLSNACTKNNCYRDDITYKDVIAWLEKQGKNDMGISEATKQELEDNLNKALEKETPDSWNKFLDEQGELKFKVGDIIKPKDGGHEPWQIMQVDMIDKKYRFKDGYVIHFSQEDNYELVEQKPAWSEDDEKIANNLISQLGNLCTRKLIKEETKDKYVNWIKSLKDRVQPKIEWSEEDERKYIQAIEALEDFGKFELADWLKEHKN